MNLHRLLAPALAFVAIASASAVAADTVPQEKVLEALQRQLPMSVLLSEVDEVIRKTPTCETAKLLLFLLRQVPENRRLVLRIARRYDLLRCEEEEAPLADELLRQGRHLGIEEQVVEFLNPRSLPDLPPQRTAEEPILSLRPQFGFQMWSDYLWYSLSPSKRYLVVAGAVPGATLSVWDLKTGYSVGKLSEKLSHLGVFLDERYLLVASLMELQIWDLEQDRKYPLEATLFGVPSVLALSPDRRRFVLNNHQGNLRIYEILPNNTQSTHNPPFQVRLRHSADGLNVQTAVFADNRYLLLGTTTGDLLTFDTVVGTTLVSISLGSLEDVLLRHQGDFSFESYRALQGGVSGVRRIVIAEDGKRCAVLMGEKLTMLARNPATLALQPAWEVREKKDFVSAVFVRDDLVVLNDSRFLTFDRNGDLRRSDDLPLELGGASRLESVEGSTVVILGSDFLALLDIEHLRIISLTPARVGAGFRFRLVDESNILLHSEKFGLQRISRTSLTEAVRRNSGSKLFDLIYRGGLIGSQAPYLLGSLEQYRDRLYWYEAYPLPADRGNDKKSFWFFYLRPPHVSAAVGTPAFSGQIRFVELPAFFEEYVSDKYSRDTVIEDIKKYRTVTRDDVGATVEYDFQGLNMEYMPRIMNAIKNRNRIAFNGQEVAFIGQGWINLFHVHTREVRRLLPAGSHTKLTFHPIHQHILAIGGTSVELWDIRQGERLRVFDTTVAGEVNRLVFDRTGSYLAIVSRHGFHVWRLADGRSLLRTFPETSLLSGASFDAVGTRLALTGIDLDRGDLMVVDLEKMEIQTYLVGGTFGLSGEVAFFGDSECLVEANILEPELSWYRLGKEGVARQLSFLFFEEGEGIFYDPSGRYWSTREGVKYLTWQHGTVLSRMGQFEKAYFDANHIYQVLIGTKQPGTTLEGPPLPPRVKIRSPVFPTVGSLPLTGEELDLSVSVESERDIGPVVFKVDGVLRHRKQLGAKRDEMLVHLGQLSNGYHQISVVATDEAGFTSFPQTYTINVMGSQQKPPRLFFLGIGADRAQKPEALSFAHTDARLLASRFAAVGDGRYWRSADARVLPPPEVTPEGIERVLRELADELTPADLLVIYLAGHGRREHGRDAHLFLTNDKPLRWFDLAGWVSQVPSRILVLLDTCRGGYLDLSGTAADPESLTGELLRGRESGVLVFSASRSWQRTFEWQDLGGGAFATAICRAFGPEADSNGDQVVSLSELFNFVRRDVENITREKLKIALGDLFQQASNEWQPNESFDREFFAAIQIPHDPWIPDIDTFGDIPLIPVSAEDSGKAACPPFVSVDESSEYRGR